MLKLVAGSLPTLLRQDLGIKALIVCGSSTQSETNTYHEDRYHTGDKVGVLLELKALARLYMSIGGNVCCPCRPHPLLLDYWSKKLHNGRHIEYNYLELGANIPHVVNFPMSYLDRQLHWVDPDVLFQLHSKRFITEIPCPQASVLDPDNLTFPCVLKACRSQGGKGTFIVRSQAEYDQRMKWLQDNLPHAETIVNQFIEEDKGYGVHAYINKSGSITIGGIDEPEFDGNMGYIGARYNHDEQEHLIELLAPSIEPVVKSMHQHGYFGFISIDVLLDKSDKQYVVDINPRTSSIQLLFDPMPQMAKLGYTFGILRRGEMPNCTLPEFLGRMESLVCRMQRKQGPVVSSIGSSKTDDLIDVSAAGDNCKEPFDIIERVFDNANTLNAHVPLVNKHFQSVLGTGNICETGTDLDAMMKPIFEAKDVLKSGDGVLEEDGKDFMRHRKYNKKIHCDGNNCAVYKQGQVLFTSIIPGDNTDIPAGDVAVFAAIEPADGTVMFLVGIYSTSLENCQKILNVSGITTLIYN